MTLWHLQPASSELADPCHTPHRITARNAFSHLLRQLCLWSAMLPWIFGASCLLLTSLRRRQGRHNLALGPPFRRRHAMAQAPTDGLWLLKAVPISPFLALDDSQRDLQAIRSSQMTRALSASMRSAGRLQSSERGTGGHLRRMCVLAMVLAVLVHARAACCCCLHHTPISL